jgi:CO dehydrogenase/acetyl-CoA synthase gamma subunit (corrinoid Fe-S protein)
MVVEEFSETYPLDASDLLRYLPRTDCGSCGFASCEAFAEQLVAKTAKAADCPELDTRMAELMDAVLPLMPRIFPYDQWMKTVEEPYRAYGDPGPDAPVLVTANFVDTITVLDEIFQASGVSLHLLISDTHGYSVDNAVEERWFKAGNIMAAITAAGIGRQVSHTDLLIPGLAERQRSDIQRVTRWHVEVGPVSGFEIPLFLATLD